MYSTQSQTLSIELNIQNKDNPTEPILLFTLFGTKTKPKHQLTCHPYFTKHIFIPEILKRNENTKIK
jgi:hypothetical protein